MPPARIVSSHVSTGLWGIARARRARSYSEPWPNANARPRTTRTGAGTTSGRGLPDVGRRYADAFDVANPTTHPHREGAAEPHVDTQTERKVDVAIPTAEPRHDDRVRIGSEDRIRILQLEAPSHRETDRDEIRVIAIAHVGAETYCQSPVQREALAVRDDAGPEVAPEKYPGPSADGHAVERLIRQLGEAATNTEVVRSPSVAIKSFQRKRHTFAGIRKGSAELMAGERAIRRLEHRRSGLLSRPVGHPHCDRRCHQEPTAEPTTHEILLERVR